MMTGSRVGTNRAKSPQHYLIAYSDGGARGNPGPAGYGVVIRDQSGRRIAALSEYLGHQTNNVAEYRGLIAALQYASEQEHKALKVISDSELLVKQIKGLYKVKNSALQQLHGRARDLIAQLDWFSIEHVLRGHNHEADALANAAMDQGMGRSSRVAEASARQIQSRASASLSGQAPAFRQEFEGIVRDGKIELTDGSLPEGTRVQVRPKN